MFGIAKRNVPVRIAPKNPLPENAKSSDCGDAGRDGYSCLSTADRETGTRPSVGGVPVREHPRDWLP
jgi:hypothetical protein